VDRRGYGNASIHGGYVKVFGIWVIAVAICEDFELSLQ
jgi:hypothetical protein